MATTYTIDTVGAVTPEDKGGPRVGVAGVARVSRPSVGAVGVLLLRGDGADPEVFDTLLRCRWFDLAAATVTEVSLATLDLALPDFTPRRYRLKVVGDGASIDVTFAFVSTEPSTPPGLFEG